MVISTGYFRASYCIQLIIQRSEYNLFALLSNTNMSYRVLLSTIKKNAEHPCPRCLVKKVDTIKMGMKLDMRSRCDNIHIDDHIRQTMVDIGRRLVFEQGIPLVSKQLKEVLRTFSGIPTHVSLHT